MIFIHVILLRIDKFAFILFAQTGRSIEHKFYIDYHRTAQCSLLKTLINTLQFFKTMTLTKISFIGVIRFCRTSAEICFADTTTNIVNASVCLIRVVYATKT